MTMFPFHYKGKVTLSGPDYAFDLHNCELWEERGIEEHNVGGYPVYTDSGMHSWHGVARVLGLSRRLMDHMGDEMALRLADGRLGHALVTGYCEDSIWVLEITGVGHVPHLNTI